MKLKWNLYSSIFTTNFCKELYFYNTILQITPHILPVNKSDKVNEKL